MIPHNKNLFANAICINKPTKIYKIIINCVDPDQPASSEAD